MVYVKNRALSVNTVVFFECEPEILDNSEEFFWILLYQRQCVNQEFCSYFER